MSVEETERKDVPTEFVCALCETTENWSTEQAAKAAAVWHVFTRHLNAWTQLAGFRGPVDPRPERLGRRL